MLHESVHATFYVPGQSALNESVAEFLGDHLAVANTSGSRRSARTRTSCVAYLDGARERDRHAAAFHAAHDALAKLYDSPKSLEQKLAEKATILRRLSAETEFSRPITNATLARLRVVYNGRQGGARRALRSVRPQDVARPRVAQGARSGDSFSKPHEQDLSRVLAPLVRRAHAARLARRGGEPVATRR